MLSRKNVTYIRETSTVKESILKNLVIKYIDIPDFLNLKTFLLKFKIASYFFNQGIYLQYIRNFYFSHSKRIFIQKIEV